MSERKIVVPEGMLEAVADRCADYCKYGGTSQSVKFVSQTAVEAALLWLSENPMRPSDSDVKAILEAASGYPWDGTSFAVIRVVAENWQRRMFLAPEPEVPDMDEIIISALQENQITVTNGRINASAALQAVAREAYRRGQKSKEKP